VGLSLKELTEELLAAYVELRRVLSRRLGNTHDAADVAQSSFERVYAHALAAPITSPRALLFRTARNLCVDQGRRNRIEARVLGALGVVQPTTFPSAERVAAQREAIARVAARVNRLPTKRRHVFILVRVHGCTHREVAQRLGLSVDAVEKHVVRATLDCSDVFTRYVPE
jgi:RNA polymerase sigma-70 factor (ECF subfamily)